MATDRYATLPSNAKQEKDLVEISQANIQLDQAIVEAKVVNAPKMVHEVVQVPSLNFSSSPTCYH